LHGGTVEVRSPGEEAGATFVVSLPVQIVHRGTEPAHTAAPDADLSALNVDLKGVRVLVVDDEPDARHLVQRLLSEFGADVELAGSVDEALDRFRSQKPDVLLSDIGMPDRDGHDLIREIRALPEADGGAVPAAALTALARVEDRKRAMLAGYQAHVTKPVDTGELVAVVATLCGRTGR
jgi:CheY-like chemotaxis protein